MTKQAHGLIWKRCPQPHDEYALVLANPDNLDVSQVRERFVYVQSGRGLGKKKPKHLDDTARKQIAAWIDMPADPLPSHAYKKLSDWFLTNSPERKSRLAYACKCLWSALFRAEPGERLTNPGPSNCGAIFPGAIFPERFKRWWKTQSAWQEF